MRMECTQISMNKVNTKGSNTHNIITNYIYANIREDLPGIMDVSRLFSLCTKSVHVIVQLSVHYDNVIGSVFQT